VPFNERWGCFSIVDNYPLKAKQSELIGGIKNALERGETPQRAKQTFVNAGYSKEEVESAEKELSRIYSSISAPLVAPIKEPVPENITSQFQLSTQNNTSQFKSKSSSSSKTKIIVLMIIAILILIGAALTGLFWNKITGLFK